MVSDELPRLTITNPNCIRSTRFAFDSCIGTRNGPSLLGADFQIRNLKYYHFYLTELPMQFHTSLDVFSSQQHIVQTMLFRDRIHYCRFKITEGQFHKFSDEIDSE